jgi:hypothetical protein
VNANVSRIRSVVVAFGLALLMMCGRGAQAAVGATPDCDASGSSFKCELQGFLHFLYAAAGLLAVVLVGVVWAAVHIYRQKADSVRKNKNAVEDDE